jgi:hypothetical protein
MNYKRIFPIYTKDRFQSGKGHCIREEGQRNQSCSSGSADRCPKVERDNRVLFVEPEIKNAQLESELKLLREESELRVAAEKERIRADQLEAQVERVGA